MDIFIASCSNVYVNRAFVCVLIIDCTKVVNFADANKRFYKSNLIVEKQCYSYLKSNNGFILLKIKEKLVCFFSFNFNIFFKFDKSNYIFRENLVTIIMFLKNYIV